MNDAHDESPTGTAVYLIEYEDDDRTVIDSIFPVQAENAEDALFVVVKLLSNGGLKVPGEVIRIESRETQVADTFMVKLSSREPWTIDHRQTCNN